MITQYYLPLFVQSGLILSADYISTCNKYHLSLILPSGVFRIKNNLSFDLKILLLLMVDGSCVFLNNWHIKAKIPE